MSIPSVSLSTLKHPAERAVSSKRLAGLRRLPFARLVLASLASLLLSTLAMAADSLDTIIIDAGYDKQTSIAIVPFSQGPEFADLTGTRKRLDLSVSQIQKADGVIPRIRHQ